MKKFIILGVILLFAYAAYVPPDGMRKIPIASVKFEENATKTASDRYQDTKDSVISNQK